MERMRQDEIHAGMSLLQLHEIEEGRKNGLCEEQIALYDQPYFDHLQMQEVRLALQAGMKEEQIRFFARESFDHKQMNHIRIELMRGNMLEERAKADLIRKRLKNMLKAAVVAVCLLSAIAIAISVYRYEQLLHQPLKIVLKENEITVPYGSTVVPLDHIEEYTMNDDTELVVPDSFKADFLGDTEVIFILKNREKTETVGMTVHIKDETAPILLLEKESVKLERNTEVFDPFSYIKEANDDVDGACHDRVTVSEFDPSKDRQIITYTLEDSSGNSVSKDLALELYDKPVQEEKIVYVEKKVKSEQVKSGKAGVKTFLFSKGYTIDTAYDACVAFGKKHVKYTCEPIRKDGIYTGYRCTYQ